MAIVRLLAATAGIASVQAANPIRRVVTLLQEMSEEISAELEKERDMHEKFACYCKKNDGELDKKAKEAAALIKKTKSVVASNTALKKQLAEELKKHKKERSEAEKKLEVAIKKRTDEKAKYDEATKDQRKTISDLDKAVTALEKGMGKSFVQGANNEGVKALRRLVDSGILSESDANAFNLDVGSQQAVLSFLSGGAKSSKDYSTQSGEIVGILKMIKQNIDEELGGVIQDEEAAVKSFNLLKKSLQELVKTSTSAIDKKSEVKGEAAVKVVEGKNLISTTEKQMGDDMATLAQLKESCKDKAGEYEERQKDGAGELEAIHMAIGVLNDDDSLELFKKTDTKAMLLQTGQKSSMSLLQRSKNPIAKVAEMLNSLKNNSSGKANNPSVALMAFSTRQALASAMKTGQAVDFSKIYKMIDDMVALLKKESADDLTSRDACNEDLNENAAQHKETEQAVKNHEAAIENLAASIDQYMTAIERNTDEIAAAKGAMAGASKQRTEENAEFIKAVELNKEAVELIAKAKDKLNAYYNPQLVRKTERVETDEEAADRVSSSFVQIRRHMHKSQAPLPEGQPDMWEGGARKNKGQKGSSVLALMDTLSNDLNKDTDAMSAAENTAQRDYEKLSNDLARQVVESNKALNQANKSKADAESEKQTVESTLSMKEEELADIVKTTADLHAKCDFLLANFEERAMARENEIAGLGKAKAILAGANFE